MHTFFPFLLSSVHCPRVPNGRRGVAGVGPLRFAVPFDRPLRCGRRNSFPRNSLPAAASASASASASPFASASASPSPSPFSAPLLSGGGVAVPMQLAGVGTLVNGMPLPIQPHEIPTDRLPRSLPPPPPLPLPPPSLLTAASRSSSSVSISSLPSLSPSPSPLPSPSQRTSLDNATGPSAPAAPSEVSEETHAERERKERAGEEKTSRFVYYINEGVYGSFKDRVLVQESFTPNVLWCKRLTDALSSGVRKER